MKKVGQKEVPWRNSAVLNEIGARACDRLGEFLDELGVKLRREGRGFTGSCPIHGGNSGSFTIYPEGSEVRGYWRCRTRKCHESFTPSLVGFVRGVLSAEEGWSQPGDARITVERSARRICQFIGVDLESVRVNDASSLRRAVARDALILSGNRPAPTKALCRSSQLSRLLDIPSPYFRSRGFSDDVLTKFQVGTVKNPASEHCGRAFVPIFDDEKKVVLAGVTRSPHPRCEICGLHHGQRLCPRPDEKRLDFIRWRVVGNDKHFLYNAWGASSFIKASRCVVVVEGAGDVWGLEQAGIHNAVGLFGSDPSPMQLDALMAMIPRTIIALTDDDQAGNACAETLARKCHRFSDVIRVLPVGSSEVGDMKTEDIRKYLLPQISRNK
jgi:5S rRNA maturation endonuclease (ribonuclease M5)